MLSRKDKRLLQGRGIDERIIAMRDKLLSLLKKC